MTLRSGRQRTLATPAHLSDNDGLEDQNLPMTATAWFWPYRHLGLDNRS